MTRYSTGTLERWKPDPCYLQLRKSGAAMQGDMKLCTWGAGTEGWRWMGQLTHSKQGGVGYLGGSLAFGPLNNYMDSRMWSLFLVVWCLVPSCLTSGPRMCGGIGQLKDYWPSEWEVTYVGGQQTAHQGKLRVFSHDVNMDQGSNCEIVLKQMPLVPLFHLHQYFKEAFINATDLEKCQVFIPF